MLIREKLNVLITIPPLIVDVDEIKDVFLSFAEQALNLEEKDISVLYLLTRNGITVCNGSITNEIIINVTDLKKMPDKKCISIILNSKIVMNSVEILKNITDEISRIKTKLDSMQIPFSFTVDGNISGSKFTFMLEFDLDEKTKNYKKQVEINDFINKKCDELSNELRLGGLFVKGDNEKFYLLCNHRQMPYFDVLKFINKFSHELKTIGEYDCIKCEPNENCAHQIIDKSNPNNIYTINVHSEPLLKLATFIKK